MFLFDVSNTEWLLSIGTFGDGGEQMEGVEGAKALNILVGLLNVCLDCDVEPPVCDVPEFHLSGIVSPNMSTSPNISNICCHQLSVLGVSSEVGWEFHMACFDDHQNMSFKTQQEYHDRVQAINFGTMWDDI